MSKHDDLINRAQQDLDEFGQISRTDAQVLINALIEATSKDDRVFVCNGGKDEKR